LNPYTLVNILEIEGGEIMSDPRSGFIQSEIFDSLCAAPNLDDVLSFSTTVEKKGLWPFRKFMIHLTGTARSEEEKRTVEEIAREHAHGCTVVDDIKVVH
jgi:hypothetical protein